VSLLISTEFDVTVAVRCVCGCVFVCGCVVCVRWLAPNIIVYTAHYINTQIVDHKINVFVLNSTIQIVFGVAYVLWQSNDIRQLWFLVLQYHFQPRM